MMRRLITGKLRPALYLLTTSALLNFGSENALAQVTAGSYSFSQNSGTYTPITGGTVVNSAIPDSYQSGAITLTPGFTFCGTTYTTAYMTSNGLISLGGSSGPGTTQYNGIANNGNGSGIHICPFNSDQIGSSQTGAQPEMRYEVVGNEHVFQWKDISRYPAATDRFSYQARLNAVTGVITFVYTVNAVGTSTSYQPVVGIRTANTAGNWQSRLVANNAASSWAASAAAANTTDVLRFTSTATNPKQPVNGQTYIFTPPPPCTAATPPAVSAANASPLNICLSGTTDLSITATLPPATGYTFQWQRAAAAAGPYTTIAVTSSPNYTANVTASSYFRCRVLCNNDSISPFWTSSASAQVVVNDPGTPTVTGGSRCGPGVVTLNATPPAGASISWYDAPTGGIPVATTPAFTTPYLTQTTTFYAAAGSGSTTLTAGRPAPQATSTTYSYYTNYGLIFDATQAFTIQSVDVYHTSTPQGSMYVLLKNSAGTTLQTAGPFTLPPGTGTTVGGGATPTTLPVNILVPGAGTGYRLVDSARTGSIIRDNPVSGWSYPLPIGAMGSITGGLLGGSASTGAHYYFYNWTVITGCEGNRVPVTATINNSPAVTKTAPAVVCNNDATAITLTPPSPAYPSYTWTPVTDLYTDAAATVPYTGGSATMVYMKTTNVGEQTYYMMAGNPNVTAGCTFADTVRIWSQPANVSIKALPDTICINGTTTLSLDTADGYYPGSIQWQDSVPGTSTSYTDIAGATGTSYTTPTLGFGQNRYYRALIRAGSNICQSPVKYVVISNPTLLSWADSFNCGPGTVTLNAEAGGFGNIRWYDSPTADLPVGFGSTWTTPYIGATTTYYVESGTGAIQPPPTFIGSGTSTNWWGYLPYFATYYTASKAQWLITAAEMQAAGFSPGLITDIAFEVTTKSGTTTIANLTYSMKAISGSTMGATFHTGMQQVYTTTGYDPTANAVNNHTLQSPFYWDGVSSIILEECSTNPSNQYGYVNVKYNSGSTLYYYTSSTSATGTNCSAPTGLYTSTTRPNIRLTMLGGCQSAREAVTAYIHPVPDVDLGPDINECVDAGAVKVLDAGVQPNNATYLWDNGSTSQVRAVSTSGSYSVSVTNQYTCEKSDTINVTLRKNPVVELGNDTTVCNGVVLPLNAGADGIDYFWNTGETTQQITVNSPGSYNVFVTNSLGCTKTDTITVNMSGELPTISGINISNNGQNTFNFTAVNPQNVIGYDWDFGDGSPHSYQAAPSHTYANSGNYIVVLKLSSSCGFYDDSTSAHIVGIHQLNLDNSELMVYPNPGRELVTIENHSGLKMERIELYNVLGQVVYRADADSKDKHVLRLSGIASGLYTIQVYTDKGTIARKLEIMK